MPLQAEIQKRQQAVSDLKRQVEQMSALAGEDKKAGIGWPTPCANVSSGRLSFEQEATEKTEKSQNLCSLSFLLFKILAF